MKKILLTLISLVCLFSCAEKLPEGADTSSLRVALTPAPEVFSGEYTVFSCAAVVCRGADINVPWTVSVDNNPDWISVEEITYEGAFTGTYDGDDRNTSNRGVKITVEENDSDSRRTAFMRFTLKDGSSVSYTIVQNKQIVQPN